MKITKYPQSAILIEYKKKRILIDPGSYCYNENFKAENWGNDNFGRSGANCRR